MEQALIGVAALIVGVAMGFAVRARVGATRIAETERQAARILAEAEGRAEAQLKDARITAREELLHQRAEQERELGDRRAEIAKIEERVISKEESLTNRFDEIARRDQSVSDRETHARQLQEELKTARDQQLVELERISSMTSAQAKDMLLQTIEEQARHSMAKVVRQVEEETKLEADRRARNILSIAIQRTASAHTAETTVSVVQLPSDDLKGRIIGREGRNIRALENLTGVDFIIDDTPQAVVLSAFDGVRRATARLTLEKLIADGRIHPSRIEEMYYQSKAEIEQQIIQAGEQACFEANVHGLHPELVKILGRLHYRTSYGQNVLKHSIECAHLAAIMAAELGASQKTARRAALLHDIGKAVSHEVEGSHAVISAEMARKFRESPSVAHAIEAHHYDVEPQTVESVLVIAADSVSASRPGGRGESLEHYIKRLEALEEIANAKKGVDRVYAMQAGREVRVMVKPEEVDDDTAALLSHEIAREIEGTLEYPGQIKVTVIRESRAVDVAH
ncbi:MAG: ribonucrease [Gaiellales bacterium]|jgi:ribonuclease Y|nr:ribonucrease [Gaiellales bacterium]